MRGILSERVGRAAVALLVAAMTTVGALFIFTAGARDRFEPLETAALSPSDDIAQPQPGIAQDMPDETLEESEEPAPEPVAEMTTIRRSILIADFLSRAGLNVFEAERWAGAFRTAAHSRNLSRGHLVSLERDALTGELRGLSYEIDDRSEIVEKTLGNGVIIASQQPIRYRVQTDSAAFAIKGSLAADATRHRIPKAIVDRLLEAFGSAPQHAVGVKVVYQEYVSLDGVHRFLGDLQAAELQTRSRSFEAFAFRDSYGRSHLYDEQGKPLGQRFLRFPLPFEYVSSGFSHARYHPILHYYRQHVGVDLVAKYGTPVKAVADGRVEFASWGGELGRCIRLEHDNRMISIYGHLSRISNAVREGAYVTVGQIIGWVGTSGLSTGPHLHFGLMKNGNYVNPLTVRLDSRGSEISPRMHAVFEEIRQEYEKTLNGLPQSGGVATAKAGVKHPVASMNPAEAFATSVGASSGRAHSREIPKFSASDGYALVSDPSQR
jgi:murein DD-endopeptidase MepM/ murein hydrolase activator NlpD